MNQVIVFPRGQLSAEDKASMREMGIAVVEADDPSKVVTVIPVAPSAPVADPDDFTMSLLVAVSADGNGYAQTRAIKELTERMRAREKTKVAKACTSGAASALSKIIGWRTADYTAETDDVEKARNWSSHVTVLPIFEGDPNTKLVAAPEVKP